MSVPCGALPALLAGLLLAGCADRPTEPRAASERRGGEWATWVLPHGAALRPAAPPAAGTAEARAELEAVLRAQAALTPEAKARIRRWDGAPTLEWSRATAELLNFYWPLLPDVRTATPARAARAMALLHVAQYDALVATWDAKYAYGRKAPHAADPRVKARVRVPDAPSYPSEHAAAAAAAAEILAYAFPGEDPARFRALAREAGESRVAAGAAYPGDVEAGYAIGREVARRVIEVARADGADRPWSGSVPAGELAWRPTPPRRVKSPFDPAAGSWRTWVLPRGDAFRPAPPPAPGSAAWSRDLEELRRLSGTRTAAQADVARYWATDAPSIGWEGFLNEELERRRWPALHAARAHALVSVAMYDAFVACWDAKFHYWLLRPVSADSTLRTVFSTPPFPSYPSGHSTISAAAAEVLAELFPDAARKYREKAHEASVSRVYGGVHYRFDVLAGEELGEKVGRAVVERARGDGSRRSNLSTTIHTTE